MLGCGRATCQRLPLENGDKVFNTLLFVCKYTPTFFSRDDGMLYREGPCSDSTCPPDSPSCFQYAGQNKSGFFCGERPASISPRTFPPNPSSPLNFVQHQNALKKGSDLLLSVGHSRLHVPSVGSDIKIFFDKMPCSWSDYDLSRTYITIICIRNPANLLKYFFLLVGSGPGNPQVPEDPTPPRIQRGEWALSNPVIVASQV